MAPAFDAVKMRFPTVCPDPEMLAAILAGGKTATPQKVRAVLGELAFPLPPSERPYLYGCMVLSADGKMGFADDPEGTLISKENHCDPIGALTDFWMMNVCRAYADAVILGANTLKARLHRLWCAEITDPDLVAARRELGKKTEQPLSAIASLDGRDVPLTAQILDMHPAPAILTSKAGAAFLQANLLRPCEVVEAPEAGQAPPDLTKPAKHIRILAAGGDTPDTAALLRLLRAGGVGYASVEAPGYIWHLIGRGLLDEYLLNYSGVMAGGAVALGAAAPFTAKSHPHTQLLMLGWHRGFVFTRQRLVYGR